MKQKTKNKKRTRINYDKLSDNVKEFMFSFNNNILKVKRKEEETDVHFLKRIITKRNSYLKNITKLKKPKVKVEYIDPFLRQEGPLAKDTQNSSIMCEAGSNPTLA